MPRHRYAIRLAYEGRSFRGFQRQPGLPTVQEALGVALAAAGLGDARRLTVAARTDAGVHALDQVVGLTVERPLDVDLVRRALNRSLPAGILCLEVREASAAFHARASARSRRYVYLVGVPPPPGLEPYAWSLPDPRAFPGVGPRPLDVAAMRTALVAAVGRHDFAGFSRPGAQRETVRELLRADVLLASDAPLVALVFEATGFLRAMVRNLAGTAVTIGLGLAPVDTVAEILERPGRYRGVRAPGWGLTLAAVSYPGSPSEPERPSEPA
jgi:tRNA pseudouridine38-40 synthase